MNLNHEPPRTTTTEHAPDLSRGQTGASSEAALFNGYRSGAQIAPRYRTEPCVCGEDIRAETGWEGAAIDDHNAGLRHQSWRASVLARYQ